MNADKETKSKALLDMESDSKTSIESKLLFCKKDDLFKFQTSKQETSLPDKKPYIFSVPESQVLGKAKDFLGVLSEANKRLQTDAEDNSDKYDIEAPLTGNESQYIEMDLMLGVTDLHTPEAVAAAESAISGLQPVIPLTAGSSDDDESDNDDNEDESDIDEKTLEASGANSSREAKKNNRFLKRPKIVELS